MKIRLAQFGVAENCFLRRDNVMTKVCVDWRWVKRGSLTLGCGTAAGSGCSWLS